MPTIVSNKFYALGLKLKNDYTNTFKDRNTLQNAINKISNKALQEFSCV